MTQKKTSVPPEKQRKYEQLLASVVGIEAKSNFGSRCTAVNGNMYTMISKHGVVGIRLPEKEHARFLEEFQSELFRGDPSWPPAKEFVAVPEAMLEDTETLKTYLELSYRYVQTLKPKPTKRS